MDPDAEAPQDGVLRWFEEYARLLTRGSFFVMRLKSESAEISATISLFSAAPPFASEAITGAIRIRASPIFIPERTQGSSTRYFFAYRCCLINDRRE